MQEKITVLILAGGRGERLRPITDEIPKPLVKVSGRPILEHILERLIENDFCDIRILTGYLPEKIDRFILDYKEKYRSNCKVLIETIFTGESSSISQRVNMGLCLPNLKKYTLILYGDTIASLDYTGLLKKYSQGDKDGFVVGVIPVKSSFGLFKLSDNSELVVSYKEKPILEYYINIGFLFSETRNFAKNLEGYTFEDFLTSLVERGKLSAFIHNGIHYTINNISELEVANKELA